ncbi:PspC domain-containing protein [Oceanitalea stevensii]|uniref:PspC domain-containing protein n=1 Tax=Oceanitalea stevensii TaxID=2763072 RepID=A0ABR8Z3B9_9MICO|nr:PspC domain-containing protein [Oceanitalea stevensii]MBD8062416.1 PspC domain-containing protein [Oceanitalea stevensii]
MSTFFDSIRRTGFRRGPQRILGGVCGGVAARLGANVMIVRLLLLLAFLLPGIGWVLYVALWALLPWQDGSIPLERVLSR